MHREGHVGAALALYAPVGFLAFVSGFRSLAVLGAIGFFGGALLFVMDISRQRIFGYGAAVVAVQIAVWVLQGANHGSFGLALYGLETVLAGLLLGNYLLYRTDRFRSPIERTGEPIEGSRESIERTREIE